MFSNIVYNCEQFWRQKIVESMIYQHCNSLFFVMWMGGSHTCIMYTRNKRDLFISIG